LEIKGVMMKKAIDPEEIARLDAESKLRKQKSVELKAWFKQYKSTLKCRLCNENASCCLDFHHRDPKERRFYIGMAIQEKVIKLSKEDIIEEINKCDVLCSNCHRKLHFASRSKDAENELE
jgi:ubiquitin C-terminal hydrolase